MNDVLKVGVIGMGFVGSAVYGGFANGKTIGYAVDPKLGDQSVTYRELSQQGVDVVFLCLPTPSRPKLNDVDPTIVYNVLDDLRRNAFSGLVAIKSRPHNTSRI